MRAIDRHTNIYRIADGQAEHEYSAGRYSCQEIETIEGRRRWRIVHSDGVDIAVEYRNEPLPPSELDWCYAPPAGWWRNLTSVPWWLGESEGEGDL
jgi:hypothetical protein